MKLEAWWIFNTRFHSFLGPSRGEYLTSLHKAGVLLNTPVHQFQFVYDCSSFKVIGTYAVFIFKCFLPSSLAHLKKNIFLTNTLKNWRWNISYTIIREIFSLLAKKAGGTLLFMYFRPSSIYSLDQDKMTSLFYTFMIPMLNPLIYSLQNKDVKIIWIADVSLYSYRK